MVICEYSWILNSQDGLRPWLNTNWHGLHGFTRINLYLVFNSWIIKAGWPSARLNTNCTDCTDLHELIYIWFLIRGHSCNSWIIKAGWPSARVEHELHGLHGFTRIILYLVFNSWIIKAGWPSARLNTNCTDFSDLHELIFLYFNSWVIKAGWPSAMVEHELTRISRIYANYFISGF